MSNDSCGAPAGGVTISKDKSSKEAIIEGQVLRGGAPVSPGYARRRLIRRGMPIRTDTYLVGDHLIWGATARILADLFDRIRPLLNGEAPKRRVSPSRSAR